MPKPGGGWMRAQRAITRGLNRNRQPILKAVFKGAATTVLTKEDHPLRKIYDKRLSEGIRPNLAKLTLARKLATLALMLWKREEEYDPTKHRPISTRRKGRQWDGIAGHRQSVLATKKVRG